MSLVTDVVGGIEGDRDCDGRRLGALLLVVVEIKEGRTEGVLVVVVGERLGRRLVGIIVRREDLEGL